jgi:hypothetical protein
VSKQYQEQTASLQTALLPETYRAGHDMSRPGEPFYEEEVVKAFHVLRHELSAQSFSVSADAT